MTSRSDDVSFLAPRTAAENGRRSKMSKSLSVFAICSTIGVSDETHSNGRYTTVSKTFFEKRTEASIVKATIVQEYFDAWSKIILPNARRHRDGRIAFVDLYAGPGRYSDGAASTSLLVIEKALETPEIAAAPRRTVQRPGRKQHTDPHQRNRQAT